MQIVDFIATHVEQAARIAKQNYDDERSSVTVLPLISAVPDLTPFAENGLGVAAFDGGEMVGFLCCVPPFKNAFRSTDAIGVFSPMGANGAVGSKRAEIYARMYQAAGEKWAHAGAASHAVCLYAHDKEAQEQFYRYGFGMRTVDALRMMDEIEVPPCKGYIFEELSPEDNTSVFPLDQMLNQHQCESPFFMNRKPSTLESFVASYTKHGSRFFAAKNNGEICAYLKILKDGETFIVDADDYIHIGGAYCLPEHRGKGVYSNLINRAVHILKAEGYTRLGVDFESINPTAWGFWIKYFAAYTYGVVRRIDEHSITKPR
ncbi:ribosomal protein S18 acetylase RimI-like enzyme [Anaerotaenia torta]|uniref:GNAT family N-acetyltransferase n=1 Tax=Anaerotaenia torta TaxID=433293 RepID=UPI003D1DA657